MLESLFNSVVGFQACKCIIKRLQYRCFPVNTAKFLRTPIWKKICEKLLLYMFKLHETLRKYEEIYEKYIHYNWNLELTIGLSKLIMIT